MRACPLLQSLKFKITGVAVIDVVEGQSALYSIRPNLLSDSYPQSSLSRHYL